MATSLDRKAFQLAEYSRRIQRLEAEVEELRPKKRKKVVPEDPNKKFVTIENVIAVKENLLKLRRQILYLMLRICVQNGLFTMS